ncbi:MAG: MarR family winged helix-turn-helix transcriptional regulator [Chloroflexia bacterium]
MTHGDTATVDAIDSILDLDNAQQQIMRNSWPEAWLQINLPLGSTRALLAIEGRNARTPSRVAEVLGVSRTTVTGMLDRLEAEGLLTRAIDPTDRRCFVLQLTPKARELIEQIENHRRSRIEKALTGMEPANLEALRQGMEALVARMHSIERQEE